MAEIEESATRADESDPPEALTRMLRRATRAEVLWVDPDCEDGPYHGFRIRGRARVEAAAVAELARQVEEGLRTPTVPTECFDPHYGLRLRADDGEVELLFCFPCGNVQVVWPDGSANLFPTGARARRLLRRLLARAGILPWWRFWD